MMRWLSLWFMIGSNGEVEIVEPFPNRWDLGLMLYFNRIPSLQLEPWYHFLHWKAKYPRNNVWVVIVRIWETRLMNTYELDLFPFVSLGSYIGSMVYHFDDAPITKIYVFQIMGPFWNVFNPPLINQTVLSSDYPNIIDFVLSHQTFMNSGWSTHWSLRSC